MKLAPVAISTYARLEHLKKTVAALAANDLADQSDLFFLSDAPRPGDEEKVAATRAYLDTVTGFGSVTVLKRKTNDRAFNNRDGIRQLLEIGGTAIYLEEDIVTAPGFLSFVNKGLNTYRDRADIFAICGFTPPIRIPPTYEHEAILSPRFSAWGFGIWKDRYESVVYDKSKYVELLNDRSQVNAFRKNGEDLPTMLRSEVDGKLDAFDVKVFFTQFVKKQYVVSPAYSLTGNNGMDGTGLHCRVSNRFDVDLPEQATRIELPTDLAVDDEILRRLYWFRSNLPESFILRMLKQYLYRPARRLLGGKRKS